MSANATVLTKTLRLGVDEPLYVGAQACPPQTGGAIQTTGTAGTGPAYGCFGIPPQCSNYRGTAWFQLVAFGGTITTAIFKIETSLDGGNTWGTLSKLFPVTAAAVTLTTYSTITTGSFTPTTPIVIGADISGLGGNGMLRLNFTTVTLGSGGTGFDVYAHIG